MVNSAVGFSQCEKTVYLSALLHELQAEHLARVWPGFHSLVLDDANLQAVSENAARLREGRLPAATPRDVLRPTLLRLCGVPGLGGSTLCLYDVASEAFLSGAGIGQYARYVAQAKAVLFLISLGQWQKHGQTPGQSLQYLLMAYVMGVNNRLGGDTRLQHLVRVYTKADELLASHLAQRERLWDYVRANPAAELQDMKGYLRGGAYGNSAGTSMSYVKVESLSVDGHRPLTVFVTARSALQLPRRHLSSE